VAGKQQTARYRDRTVVITIEKQQETAAAPRERWLANRRVAIRGRGNERPACAARQSERVYDRTLSKMHFGNIARPENPFSVTISS
jgi:hypothetical protein